MTRRTNPRHRLRTRPRYRNRERLPIDVADRGEEYLVQADLPGLRTQDIDVRVKTNRVQITADFGPAPERARRQERPVGEVSRTIYLPEKIDERRVDADYHDGVLVATLRKRRSRRSIDVE